MGNITAVATIIGLIFDENHIRHKKIILMVGVARTSTKMGWKNLSKKSDRLDKSASAVANKKAILKDKNALNKLLAIPLKKAEVVKTSSIFVIVSAGVGTIMGMPMQTAIICHAAITITIAIKGASFVNTLFILLH